MASIDRTELLRLYQTLGPALTLYARTWLDAAGAQDAVQEAFLSLHAEKSIVEHPRAWLYTAVRNRAIQMGRSRRRRERRERAAEGGGAGRPLRADPGALVDLEAVAAALEALGPEDREVVVLRVWGGLTFEEIAAVSGASAPTAFRRFRAALGAIRQKLENTCTRPTT